MKPQIADTELQHRVITQSGLDWVIARPVHLSDAREAPPAFLSTEGKTGEFTVSRRSVARFLADAVSDAGLVHKSVAISGPPQAHGA